MSQTGTRQPPRFVPTLTDVVAPEQVLHTATALHSVPSDAVSPPVEMESIQPSPQDSLLLAEGAPHAPPAQDWAVLAQSMQASVMARVDASLEERLRYALADMVQMHSQSLYHALRVDVERVVSAAVHEAVAQELAHLRKPPDIF